MSDNDNKIAAPSQPARVYTDGHPLDEVHYLVVGDPSAGYRELARLAHGASKLLLLSATPVMDDNDATLRLFHLLDPVAYRLEDVEAFAERMDRRLEIGRVLLVLSSGSDDFVLSRAVDLGRKALPDDAMAQGHPLDALLDPLRLIVTTLRIATHAMERMLRPETVAVVGASRERVNKAISSFIRLGWLEQNDRRYRILQRDRLTLRSR